jgi:hypothetical protein
LQQLRPFYANDGWRRLNALMNVLVAAGYVRSELRAPAGAKVAIEHFVKVV